MKRPEQALQKACIKWLRLQYPNVLAFHPPNGRDAGSPHMGKLWKDMGVLAGVPDILVCHPRTYGDTHVCGMAIEMKSDKGKLSESQKEMQIRFSEAGWIVYECRSLEEFMTDVNDYMKGVFYPRSGR